MSAATGARPRQNARWALSFADLCLVLLAFFVLLQAGRGDRARMAQGMRAAFGGGSVKLESGELVAAALFAPGEAVLLPGARARLAAIGRAAAARHATLRIESVGMDAASARFDGWELAAARAAATARGIAAGGEPAGAIDVAIPSMTAVDAAAGQHLRITIRDARR